MKQISGPQFYLFKKRHYYNTVKSQLRVDCDFIKLNTNYVKIVFESLIDRNQITPD